MNFLRALLSWLVLAIILIALLAAAAFTTTAQTWFAQIELARHPGLHASLDSFSAGFSKVEVANLRVQLNGGTLTVPSLEASLPLLPAARDRNVQLRSLVAKGWTLDLTGSPRFTAAPTAVPAPSPAQAAAAAFSGILSGWKLPCDLSLNGADLEGDVLVKLAAGEAPLRLHVALKGGGLGNGSQGNFALEATSAVVGPDLTPNIVTAHGTLMAAMDSPRTFNRLEIKANLSATGGTLPAGFVLSADAVANRGASGETYSLDLGSGNRPLASLSAHFVDPTQRWEGTWQLDLRNSDLPPFTTERPLPDVAFTGTGQFDADPAFARVHAAGNLTGVASRLEVLWSPLDRLGEVKLGARFDLTRTAQSIRVDHLNVSLDGSGPSGAAQALQPFDFDEKNGSFKVANPGGDWLEGSIRDFPVAWLFNQIGGLTFAGGNTSAEFTVRSADGKTSLRTKAPVKAAGVSVRSGDRPLAEGLDISASVLAESGPEGWQVQWAPLKATQGGRDLATFEIKASRPPGDDQPISLSGTWTADLDALASQPGMQAGRWITARSASGDFSTTLGSTLDVEGKFSLIGHDPSHAVTGRLSVSGDPGDTVSFEVPLKITFGSRVSEFSAEGKRTQAEDGTRLDLRLSGASVAVEHLRLLGAPLAAVGGVSLPALSALGEGAPAASPVARDTAPFWGNTVGRIVVAFDRVKSGDQDYEDVDGTLDFDHSSIRLQNARGAIPQQKPLTVEGSLSFDPAATTPYHLKADASGDEVDAKTVLPPPRKGDDPLIEGRFTVSRAMTGSGVNLSDLVAHTEEQYHLTSASTGGIIRLLKTSVAEAVPEASTPVADTLGTVGSAMGSLFGIGKATEGMGKNPVSKGTDAVLNFTYDVAELGYDKITLTAIRGADRTIRLTDIDVTAPNAHLTGSGVIGYAKDQPLQAQPLSLDLRLGFRGKTADFLTGTGLLPAKPDASGYKVLAKPVHFGGTLENIDEGQWHDLLVTGLPKNPKNGK